MQNFTENSYHESEKIKANPDNTDISTWLLICIILVLINVILAFM